MQNKTLLSLDSVSRISDAENGIIYGYSSFTYVWSNLTNLFDTVPASLSVPGGIEHNIGRVVYDGITIFGIVEVSSGVMKYTDASGVVRSIPCYEVLACKVPNVKPTTIPPTTLTTTTTRRSTTQYTLPSTTPFTPLTTTPPSKPCSEYLKSFSKNNFDKFSLSLF